MAVNRRRVGLTIVFIIILTISAALFDGHVSPLEEGGRSLDVPNWVPGASFWNKFDFHLGLDLKGGTHLLYQADTSKIDNQDADSAVEGVRDVIERRVNAFGVAEPVVQVNKSQAGDYRIIVELAGIKDVNQAINMIGETPLLEFKEENPNPIPTLTPEQEKELKKANDEERAKAKEILNTVLSGKKSFEDYVKEFSADAETKEQGGDLGFLSSESSLPWQKQIYLFSSQKGSVGAVSKDILESDIGYHIVKVEEIKQLPSLVSARHILVCYKDASNCASERTKEEALAKIQSIKAEATIVNFESLAKERSDDPGSAQKGGDLGALTRGQTVKPFEESLFAQKVGTIGEPIETAFGYHIIYKYDEKIEKQFRARHILRDRTTPEEIAPELDQWLNTKLSGKQLDRASVQFDQQTGQAIISLQFDSEGDELFSDITGRNVGKPVAIFLDGEVISAPRVEQKITGGNAVITGNFSVAEAKLLAQRLNAGALPLPVHLVSQSTVGPTLGQVSLEKSLFAGLIGFGLVLLFMVLYYRLPGVLAGVALLLYALLVLAIFKWVPVTLTLAGIAGFILSLGMAVDANVLIFERIKEELRNGHTFPRAIPLGFERAWTSIRDSNATTLITCAILYWFGTSVVRGFAVTLAIGVIVSMFSAITITRILIRFIEPWIKEGSALVLGAKR